MEKTQENLASPLDNPVYKAVWYKVTEEEFADILNSKELSYKTPAFKGNPNDVDTFQFKDNSKLFGNNIYVEIVKNENPKVMGVIKY